jgi:26S proteasome regulatory subunit N10
MEEQRARQEAEQRQPAGGSGAAADQASGGLLDGTASVFANVAQEAVSSGAGAGRDASVDMAAMTEEEQLAYAMQMSLNEMDQNSKNSFH